MGSGAVWNVPTILLPNSPWGEVVQHPTASHLDERCMIFQFVKRTGQPEIGSTLSHVVHTRSPAALPAQRRAASDAWAARSPLVQPGPEYGWDSLAPLEAEPERSRSVCPPRSHFERDAVPRIPRRRHFPPRFARRFSHARPRPFRLALPGPCAPSPWMPTGAS